MDEAELLRRAIAGEDLAWAEMVRCHARVMHAVVARMLARAPAPRPDAEDVLQGVFLKLWEDDRRRLRAFRGGARLSTWLVAVARRETLDRLRRGGRRAAREAEGGRRRAAAAAPGPEARAAVRDEGLRVARALERIPPRDRLLVRLVAEDGWSYRQVARVLGLRENSVGPLLQRARARLDTALGAGLEG